MKLKKVLTIYDLVFAGYGFIIGAGVYTLLGFTYKYSKDNIWISFLLGGIISLLSGFSYANLAKYYKESSAEHDYVSANISPFFGKLASFFLITTSLLSIATLSNVFSQYLNKLNHYWRFLLSYLMTDQAFSVSLSYFKKNKKIYNPHFHMLGSGFTLWFLWQISTLLGIILGNIVPEQLGLEFTIPLTFLSLIILQLKALRL